MARITRWEPNRQDVRPHRTDVTCFYQPITDESGRPILHLSTFGSTQRQSEPKVSQTIQIDLDNARELVRILVEAFGSTVLDRRQ